MAYEADIVIIGAGIAGGALATALSRRGISVLLLEKSLVHQDRVRGEFLVPWGVDEAQKLGVLDVLTEAGGHYTSLSMPYGEGVAPDEALNRAFDVGKLVPDVPGALTFGHPRVCQALDEAAQASGAIFLRGVKDLTVSMGMPPKVEFTVDGQRHAVSPRIVVGADGRGSSVARQIGARSQTATEHHFLAGLLVEGAEAWPENEFTIGTEGDVMFFVFPQGAGRVRLYLGYGLDQSGRFSGSGNERKFLDAFRLKSLPHGDRLAAARPVGPCQGYPNADTWVDAPFASGVVLIGDAAGHNDPTIGQGLSIAFRDARLVSESLLGTDRWTADIFEPYAEERRERMRRLRFSAQQYSILRAEFTDEARARRRRAHERMKADRSVALPLMANLVGPFSVPDHAFEQAAWDRLMT
jgi:2-polyprenyl-6-methoxyphenol hydroxylase-like FAD-dependent oxidoreductase